MDYQLLFAKAKAASIEALEVFESVSKSVNTKIYNHEVENFTSSNVKGISFRGIYQNKLGITYLEEDNDDLIDDVIRLIIESSQAIDSKDEVLFNEKVQAYQELPLYNPALDELKINEVNQELIKLEETILSKDERISQLGGIEFDVSSSIVHIINSYGVDLKRAVNFATVVAEIIVKDQDDVKTNFEYQLVDDYADFDFAKLADDLVSNAVKKLHASKIKSGTYDVIVQNKAMISLLGALSSSFSGESVNKGLSILKDKLNQRVFNEQVTIIDNPLMEKGVNSTPFDDEGTVTFAKNVVENGEVKTFLHSLKSAKKAQVKPTGNGFKPGYRADVNVSPTNFYLKPGEVSYDELVKKLNNGVIITSFAGMHAGMNTLTMNFSLEVEGFEVKDGKIVRPLSLMLLAGNLLKLLDTNLVTIANDLYFSYSGLGACSVLFKDCKISGE